ncbi:MAG: histidine kinase [Bacteroidales bacterium]|nr:histidine kinase [Bacteroidales bacterium]MBQ5582221.1 histidine kinase [Bacteroidales bacterium]
MKQVKDTWIIHAFALTHAIVSMVCHFVGIADDIMLTLLTMLLVVIICLRRRVGAIFMALVVVLVNIVGFGLGMGLAALFKYTNMALAFAHPLATFISTEIIGWSTEGVASAYMRKYSEDNVTNARSMRWLLLAFVVVIIFRLGIILFNSPAADDTTFFIELLLDYIFSFLAIIMVAEYAIHIRAQADLAREDADFARFRYLKLKQQVDPHFLFNSLNVLDYMIQEQSTEQASEFTHKLAEVYRYMLKHEDETTVRLRDELELLNDYVALLKVRFNEGLQLQIDIPEEYLSRCVVPCCLQLLMENAVKHNAVSAGDPLVVRIYIENDCISVSNNIRPKISSSTSTGLGLKYLRQQYNDVARKSIHIIDDHKNYTITLPLL